MYLGRSTINRGVRVQRARKVCILAVVTFQQLSLIISAVFCQMAITALKWIPHYPAMVKCSTNAVVYSITETRC